MQRTLVWGVGVQRPDSQHEGGPHAKSHNPVAALTLLRLGIQLQDGPERLVDSLVLHSSRAENHLTASHAKLDVLKLPPGAHVGAETHGMSTAAAVLLPQANLHILAFTQHMQTAQT